LLVTEAWNKQKVIAAREGVVAIAYERKYGQYSRIYQMAKLMLWTSGSGLYSCPIAMTGKCASSPLVPQGKSLVNRTYVYAILDHLDGCARVIELNGTQEMKDQVYSRLIRHVSTVH
jgi:hypothetical protein